MKLQGYDGQILAIERSSLGEPGTPADDDLLLNVTVRVRGYSAADQAWVVAGDWREFMNEMRTLEDVRNGDATLRGADIRDLEITFKATDRAGHMAVEGFVGWSSPDGFYLKCEFGFAFDAGVLGNVVRELAALER